MTILFRCGMKPAVLASVGQVHYHGILSKSKALILQHQASIGLVTYLPLQNSITGLTEQAHGVYGAGTSCGLF